VEVMRDAAGQVADDFHLLRVLESLFDPAELLSRENDRCPLVFQMPDDHSETDDRLDDDVCESQVEPVIQPHTGHDDAEIMELLGGVDEQGPEDHPPPDASLPILAACDPDRRSQE